jgi:hypothetical protein
MFEEFDEEVFEKMSNEERLEYLNNILKESYNYRVRYRLNDTEKEKFDKNKLILKDTIKKIEQSIYYETIKDLTPHERLQHLNDRIYSLRAESEENKEKIRRTPPNDRKEINDRNSVILHELIDILVPLRDREKPIVDEILRKKGKELINQAEADFHSWIDDYKRDGYKGTINLTEKHFYKHTPQELATMCDERDDLRKVNTNQYKVIYDDSGEVNFDFDIIEPNELFYQKDERFKNKKQLIEFLDKAKKVYLNSDMCFIPYTYKQDNGFYLLVINNTLQNIEDYQLKSLNFLNKQHNIYYIIETNRDDQFKDLNQLKNYILKTCQKHVNPNRDLLYLVYPKVDNFKKDKGIVRQYS